MIEKLFRVLGYAKKAEVADAKTITNDYFPVTYSIGTGTSGENVSNADALTISTVFACINIIAQDVAKIPFAVYQKSDKGKERINNSLSKALNYRANKYTSAMNLRQTLTAHALNYGNGFAEIEKDTNGNVIGLWILPPTWVKPERTETGELIYKITNSNGVYYLWANEVLHIAGLGFDGISGYNVIAYANQCFGNSKAADKFAGSFFGNGSTMGGFLEHPQNLSSDAQKRLVNSIEGRHLGADKANRIMVLEEGMKFSTYSIPPEQAQFLQTRQFNTTEITRWFRIPPHKVSDLSKATFSNIEQQSLDYVTDTLTAWFRRWEQEVWFKCLSPEQQQQGYFAEHIVEGLLRGDIASRYSAYTQGRQWGWLSVNDIRTLENMNTIEGGNQYLVPLNMTTADGVEQQIEQNGSNAMVQAFYIKDLAGKVVRAEIKELDKQLSRKDFDSEKFADWFEKFYAKHFEFVTKTVSNLITLKDASLLTMYNQIKEAEDKQEVFNNLKYVHQENIESVINELLK